MQAHLPFDNISDIRAVLEPIRGNEGANGRQHLHPLELATIAVTLEASLRLRDAILEGHCVPDAGKGRAESSPPGRGTKSSSRAHGAEVVAQSAAAAEVGALPALEEHALRICPRLQGLVNVLSGALDLKSGMIRDESSPGLAQARQERQENTKALHAEVNRWCMELFQKGASSMRVPITRRGRLCCSVQRGRSGVRPQSPAV
jgi:hypothetical protein